MAAYVHTIVHTNTTAKPSQSSHIKGDNIEIFPSPPSTAPSNLPAAYQPQEKDRIRIRASGRMSEHIVRWLSNPHPPNRL
jgi:hypothetical protein